MSGLKETSVDYRIECGPVANGEKSCFDPKVLGGISNLYLRARWVVEGIMSGIHSSRAKGFSVEFESFQKGVTH